MNEVRGVSDALVIVPAYAVVGRGCVRPGRHRRADKELDFRHDVWPRVLAAGERVVGVELDAYVRDVGDHAALAAVERDLAAGRLRW